MANTFPFSAFVGQKMMLTGLRFGSKIRWMIRSVLASGKGHGHGKRFGDMKKPPDQREKETEI